MTEDWNAERRLQMIAPGAFTVGCPYCGAGPGHQDGGQRFRCRDCGSVYDGTPWSPKDNLLAALRKAQRRD